jgi:fluoride ion exporter CrcB/FEX
MKLTAKIVTLTFIGGAIGTFARYALSTIPEWIFVNFWITNLLGVVLIAAFKNISWFTKADRKAFFTVGLTGGFTTMSGLSALMLYSWQTVILQTIAGVVLYLVIGWTIRRVSHD